MSNPEPQTFSQITEVPGAGATKAQLERQYQRYHLAASYAAGRRALEVACGSGMGLGYVGERASAIVGGDYSPDVVEMALDLWQGRIPLLRLDAQRLPFPAAAFDLIYLFEALYYLPDAQQFFDEASRVLSDDGVCLVSTVNRDWDDFSPGLFSTQYHSVPELAAMCQQAGFKHVRALGGFSVEVSSARGALISLLRRVAARSNLIPGSLKAREQLKRLFYGALRPLAPVTAGMAPLSPLAELDPRQPCKSHVIIYVVAARSEQALAYENRDL